MLVLAVDTQAGGQCNGRIVAKTRVGKALLTTTVIQPLLHVSHLTIRHPVRRPGRKPNAVAPMARGTGGIVGAVRQHGPVFLNGRHGR